MNRATCTLSHLSADHLGQWVRIAGRHGKLHAVAHSLTGVTSLDIRAEVRGLQFRPTDPDVEHWGSHKMIELLYGCELCPDPILDEEPVWLGGDDAYPTHKACAEKAIAEEKAQQEVRADG